MFKYLALALLLLGTSVAFAQSIPSRIVSAASLNPTLIHPGKTNLTTLIPLNTTTTIYFLKLYDKATAPTCGTDTPVWTIPLQVAAASSVGGIAVPLPSGGIHFYLGLGACITGAFADSDTTNAATGIVINSSFQ
jgi:hypothetical protein